MRKVVFFGDCNSYITTILFKEFVKNLNKYNLELVAVVNTTRCKKNNFLKNIVLYFIKKFFNPFDKNIHFIWYKSFLKLVPNEIPIFNELNVNNKNFILQLKRLNPDYAFVMGCPQIFKKELLYIFKKAINYHNSYLPAYRGLEATNWTMTYNEEYTGYTFHYMDENIDNGKIIYQEKVRIDYSKSSYYNELIKTKLAAKNIPKVLQLVLNNFEGHEQNGSISYFGKREKEKLLTFYNLKRTEEIQRLINIWGGDMAYSE